MLRRQHDASGPRTETGPAPVRNDPSRPRGTARSRPPRGPARIASALLVILSAATAQAQDAGDRSEEWRRQRLEKAAALAPPVRGRIEDALYRFESGEGGILERFQRGYGGFRPKLGGLATGSGFALGSEFRSDALEKRGVLFRLSGQASLKGYQLYEAQVGAPRLFGGRVEAGLTARYRNFPEEDFFGIGPDSREEDRTSFRLEDNDITGTAGFRPGEWITVGGRVGYLQTHAGSGTDERFPSIETLFDDTGAPALRTQPDYLHSGAFVDIDYRDSAVNPRAGGHYHIEWTAFDDRGGRIDGFRRVDAEIEQYVPFFNLRRVIAFRARTSLTDTGAGQRVPFFMQSTIGGSDDLRGFREFRFRGENLFLMNLEYRWEAFSGLDMAIFGDAGKVFTRRADLDFTDLEASWGFGARFNSAAGVFLRIDTGFSNEGGRVFMKFGHVF